MKRYKCADFYCLELQVYPLNYRPNGKLLTHDDTDWHIEASRMAKINIDFFEKFVEKVFNKSMSFFYTNYMFHVRETIKEVVDNWYDIKMSDKETWCQYLIPIEYQNLIDWCEEHKPEHSRVKTRFTIQHLAWRTKTNYFENEAYQNTKKSRKKFKELRKNKLNRLTIKDKILLN